MLASVPLAYSRPAWATRRLHFPVQGFVMPTETVDMVPFSPVKRPVIDGEDILGRLYGPYRTLVLLDPS